MREPEQEGAPVPQDLQARTVTEVRPPGASLPEDGAPPPEPPRAEPPSWAPAAGQLLAGRYTVLGPLGQGGMGLVLAAYDARLDRRVALKLLRRREGGAGDPRQGEARLVREAQAMARLSHPNVVAVYDAGTLEDGSVFIAMEYVEGQTLRRWREGAARSWREVLDAYVAAGRGLAAAHGAGIIHRDFKPDNVLVGVEGRVRVTDFGLARADSTPEALPARGEASTPTASDLSAPALERRLTMPGTVMGTPAYMAPEALQGHCADVSGDVYAFCVALHEALYGQQPFEAQGYQELLQARQQGRVRPAPDTSEVPEWVRRTVLRGLEAEASRRPAGMHALLEALEAHPEERRRARARTLGLGVAAILLVAVAAVGWLRQREPECGPQERGLANVWDARVKARVKQALADTGMPYASDTFERVSATLDGYAAEWVRQRTEVCEALRGQQAQPRGLMVKREECLERRRGQLRALTELLSRGPDRELVPKAVHAAQSLPPLSYCAETQALMAGVPPPEDPAVKAQVDRLGEQVDRLEALLVSGKYTEGLALGAEVVKRVEGVDHAPLRARVLYLVAALQEGAGNYPGAEHHLRQALSLAARGRDFTLLARAWSLLAMVVGERQGRLPEAQHLRSAVEMAVELSGDDRARADWLNSLGNVLEAAGRYDEARGHYERALALREKVLGPLHPDVAYSLDNLGNVLRFLGRNEESRRIHERVLALRERILGAQHPEVAYSINNLSNAWMELGRAEEAQQGFARAHVILERVLEPDHPYLPALVCNWADALADLGRHGEAQAKYEHAVTLMSRTLGPEHPRVAYALGGLGGLLADLGRYDEARQLHERALTIREQRLGAEHPDVAHSLNQLGGVLAHLGRDEEARRLHERALAVQEKVLESEHPDMVTSLVGLGRVSTKLGRHAEAHTFYTRALELGEKQGAQYPLRARALLGLGQLELARGHPAQALSLLESALPLAEVRLRAEVQFTLAQALWDAAGDRSRAMKLATEARDYWLRLEHRPQCVRVDAWREPRRLRWAGPGGE